MPAVLENAEAARERDSDEAPFTSICPLNLVPNYMVSQLICCPTVSE